jgi:antitoxin component YwqK of YwqJK toxin-antitoxin module
MKLFKLQSKAMSTILFLLGILFINSCTPDASKPKEILMNYGDGSIKSRYTEINHKKEGLMTDYYPDGKIQVERMFKNDMQVGKTTAYYESGKVKEHQYYQDGVLNGGDTVFYENGNPQFVITYAKGLKDGYLRKWGEDGSIIFEAKYENEKLVEVKGQPVGQDSIPHEVIYTKGTKVEHTVK